MLDLALNSVKTKGWLSLATLFFDNGYTVSVFNTLGAIAYSPSEDAFFSINSLDSTNTVQIQTWFAITGDRYYVGQQQILTVIASEHLQHVSFATYAHARFFNEPEDGGEITLHGPVIPTVAELDALTPDPQTGLYDGQDTACRMSGEKVSTIPLYPDHTKYYSGAIITNWKKFYKAHKAFLGFVQDVTGCGDAF